MSLSLKGLGAITMFAENPRRSKVFYQDVFGLRRVHDDEHPVAFDFGNANPAYSDAHRTPARPNTCVPRLPERHLLAAATENA